MSEHWIQKAVKHPGALHRELGVPQGEKIPAKKLAKAEKAGGKLGKRARLAETLKGLHHGEAGEGDEDMENAKEDTEESTEHGMQMGSDGYGLSHGISASNRYAASHSPCGLGHCVGEDGDGIITHEGKVSSYDGHGLGTTLKAMVAPEKKPPAVAHQKAPISAKTVPSSSHGLGLPPLPAAPAASSTASPQPKDKKEGWWKDRSETVRKGWLTRKAEGK